MCLLAPPHPRDMSVPHAILEEFFADQLVDSTSMVHLQFPLVQTEVENESLEVLKEAQSVTTSFHLLAVGETADIRSDPLCMPAPCIPGTS